jgi:hypothetical protein
LPGSLIMSMLRSARWTEPRMAESIIPLPSTGLIKRCFRLLEIDLHWLLDEPTTKSASMNRYIVLECHRRYTRQTATFSHCNVLISSGTRITPYPSAYGNGAGNPVRPPQYRRRYHGTGRSHRVFLPLKLVIKAYHSLRAVLIS